MKKLDEKNMSVREDRIPFLAEDAVKKARTKTLSSGRNVVEAVDGKLVVTHPDGSRKVLKSLGAPIPVAPGQKIIRKSK
jgi:hypothetical protein